MKQDSPRYRAAQLHQIEQERHHKLVDFANVLRNNELTYLKFAYKTDEMQDSTYIKDFQKSAHIFHTGTMNICDLWSNSQINRYVDIQKFTKDKFVLQKLVKQNNRQKLIKEITPIIINKPLQIRTQQNQKKNLKEIITELNNIHEDNIKLKRKMNRRIYCQTSQY